MKFSTPSYTLRQIFFCGVLGLISLNIVAQENALLQRDFWKQKPALQAVENQINLGNNPAELNSNAFDPLVYALLENADLNVLIHLQKQAGNGVNKRTHDGRTYLFWAAYKNNLPFMEYLIAMGAATNLTDDHGYRVMTFAASTGVQNPKLYAYLLANGANLKLEKNRAGANTLLLLMPHLKSPELIGYFQENGLTLSDVDTDGNNAFYYAAKGGTIDMLEWLSQKGVDNKNVNKQGENAMFAAAEGMRRHSNTFELFDYLERKGISATITAKNGETPLTVYAKDGEDFTVFEYLLAKGVNVNQLTAEGNNALMLAAKNNTLETVRLLASKTTDINAANKKGETALSNAVRQNSAAVVSFLLQQGANVAAKDTEGNSLVYYIAESYTSSKLQVFEDKLGVLQNAGLNLTETQANGNTFFHFAAQQNELALLQKAHELGLNINAQNKEGLTPLHFAAMKATNVKVLRYLVSLDADVSIPTNFNESAYQLALENEQLQKNNVDFNFLKI